MKQITEFIFGDVSIDFSEDERVIIQDDDVKLDVDSETFKQICIQYLCLECPDVIKFDDEPEAKPAYRYEKVTFENAWEAVKEHEESGNIFICSNDEVQNDDYPICGFDMSIIKGYLNDGSLYRRIEVTEKELAVDAAIEIICRGSHDGEAAYFRGWFGRLFDEGVLVRVNGKG